MGPGLHRQIGAAHRRGQEEHIVGVAVGAQAHAVAQGGEEIIVALGRLTQQGIHRGKEQLRQEGEDDDEGPHGHAAQVHDPPRQPDGTGLAGGAEDIGDADDHADEVGQGIHIPPRIGPQELEGDHADDHRRGQGHGRLTQGRIGAETEEHMQGQQGPQHGVAVDHPGAEVPVEEKGAGEDRQNGGQLMGDFSGHGDPPSGPAAQGTEQSRDPVPCQNEGRCAKVDGLTEHTADRVGGDMALQLQGGQQH